MTEQWDGITLEELISKLLREGKGADAVAILRLLPETLRARYRPIWKRLTGKSSEDSHQGLSQDTDSSRDNSSDPS